MIKLSSIKLNPNNPRLIRDDRFKKLVKSISEFPKMMELRPIIIDSYNMILGGNMRYRALKELKYKDISDTWVKKASELTEEEKQKFIIEDNVSFGQWDLDLLANEWDNDKLENWGLELEEKDILKKQIIEIIPYNKSHILISYPPELHTKVNEAVELLLQESDIEIERSSN
jgi:hypothetical protein